MNELAPSEKAMWEKDPPAKRKLLTDEEINAKYDSKAERIVTETNREKLQNFYESLQRPGYMDPRPFYQRRQRWDQVRQSLLVESLLINIPIPPLFVYEAKPNVYEVMDGQQRISAIKAFYSNELVLKGLTRWPELNGRKYTKLPDKIRSGIDRRSISWVTVLHESAESDHEALALKQLVFERLNTGGVELSHQEVRNCLYQGDFNNLLFELARLDPLRKAWGLPPAIKEEEKSTPDILKKSDFYLKMDDVETVLRFFALRHASHYQRGMHGFLDLYMVRARSFTAADILHLRDLFTKTLNLANDVYDSILFRPYDKKKKKWGKRPQKAYCDAVLVGFSRNLDKADKLKDRRDQVIERTREMFESDNTGLLTGRGNTKADVEKRIDVFTGMFTQIASS